MWPVAHATQYWMSHFELWSLLEIMFSRISVEFHPTQNYNSKYVEALPVVVMDACHVADTHKCRFLSTALFDGVTCPILTSSIWMSYAHVSSRVQDGFWTGNKIKFWTGINVQWELSQLDWGKNSRKGQIPLRGHILLFQNVMCKALLKRKCKIQRRK
jgi:hypothetical protein